jgi:hypothetical protein
MVSLRLREQQHSFTYLSLGISACVLWLRISSLPHSLMYTILELVFSIHTIIPLPGIISFPIIFLFFFGLIVYSLSHGFRAFQQYKYKAFLPLAINFFTVIVLLFMQYVVVLPDFYANLKEREAVVAQITSGQLTPKESQRIELPMIPDHDHRYKIYNLTLPSKSTHLSKGRTSDGEINILVDEKSSQPEMVVFFNSFGSVRNQPVYTAFVYKADAKSISQQDLFGVANLNFGIWLLESKKIKQNWFWVDLFED